MLNKKLSDEQIEQMRGLVKDGIPPQTIADHFGIAISSVHNWKGRFAADGMEFPSVRGRRSLDKMSIGPAQQSDNQPNPTAVTSNATPMNQPLMFTINGVKLQVPADAKSVSIGSDHSINIEL